MKTQFPRRSPKEYNRAEKSGHPWTGEEDQKIIEHYGELGPTKMMELIPGRSSNAISVRAKMMGVLYKTNIKKDLKQAKNPQEEKDILVEQIDYLMRSICGENREKREKAERLLTLASHVYSPEWWAERRHWRLGKWCEMFIKGYEFRPIQIDRDAFLEGDGVFIEKGGSDYAFYGRGG